MTNPPLAPSSPSQAQLAEQLRTLDVREGAVLLVHMSYRTVRPVTGGPTAVIAALQAAIGPAGTLVMPSWGDDDDHPFDPASTPASNSLGATADLFWRRPQVLRSAHPFAFAAAGPHAETVTADPLPLPPHRPESPVGRVHELNGQVLLLGVGHDANTTVHLAEVIAQVPYEVPKHCTILATGGAVRIDYVENDHCCERFALLDEWLRARHLQREGQVGRAHARLVASRDIVTVVVEHLRREPLVFLHPLAARCAECDEARRHLRWTEGIADQPAVRRTTKHD
ncbi:MAG: AAC(3)-VI family aminoglycoside N-acetyltransferase [Gemmatimonadota bacterium]|nr:AAC(3)-VI family aminoglycoside N-acetyltransferase [Gemmatimonadota bacterium]